MNLRFPDTTMLVQTGHAVLRNAFAPQGAKTKNLHAVKGSMIAREGDTADCCLLVLEGWIGLSKMLPDGETVIVDIMLPEDFMVIGSQAAPIAAWSIEALSDASYVLVDLDQVNDTAFAATSVRDILIGQVVTTQARTAELMLRMGSGSAANRLAYALLELFVRLESLGLTARTTYDFPLNQQKFGQFTGLSNVHVCRTLRRFERDGLIEYPGPGKIELCDVAALCDIASIDLDALREQILTRPRVNEAPRSRPELAQPVLR